VTVEKKEASFRCGDVQLRLVAGCSTGCAVPPKGGGGLVRLGRGKTHRQLPEGRPGLQ